MTPTIKQFLAASVFCAFVASLACTPAFAQEEPYKIGVVDMQMILAKYEKRKAKYEELQNQVKTLQAGIDAMSKKIEDAKADYDKKKKDLTSEQLLELETKIKADYSDYQNELTKSQQKIDSMEERVLTEVLKDIQEAIEVIATEGNYHLILNKGSGPRSAVLYSATRIDMTSQILAHLNK